MTLINRLISEAKSGSEKLVIREKDVSRIAQHVRTVQLRSVDKSDIEAGIRKGELKMLGVPVEVNDGLYERNNITKPKG